MKKLLMAITATLALVACNNNNTGKGNGTDKAVAPKNPYDTVDLSFVKLPEGFKISVYAMVPNARSITQSPGGVLYVGNKDEDKVYAVVDKNKDGIADTVYIIASGLNMPNGVAFKDGALYVAEVNRILRFDDIDNHLENPPAYKVVYDKYPDKAHHGWKFIAFGPDGKLYVPVGAPCNICNEKDSIFASITRINPDGSDLEIFAHGVRNTVGFAWHPSTKDLWFTENGRDMMGDDVPFCELNYAPEKGMHFGYPFYHQGDIPDPEFGKGHKAAEFVAPALKVGPHAAPLGMRFYTGSQFPEAYKNQIFIAEHGSWNRTDPYGYQVKVAYLDGNKVTKYEDFATGFLTADKKVLGPPVDIEVNPDGSIFVSDDMNGYIYKIEYKK